VATKPKKSWYGVRTLYRITAKGRPKSRDEDYDPDATLIEDRIILFLAIGFDDAIKQGTKDAIAYCRRTRTVNIYGQNVVMRFLGACEAFEMFDPKPVAGAEVFSSTELVRSAVPDRTVVTSKMGPEISENGEARRKFLNGGIWRKALALMALSNNPAKSLRHAKTGRRT
jgi:hypothetical protein